ncbi:MAG: VOC family protein [Oscillatoria sp. SIO1A7]|nr:VOC family protein [Oscillatoria sp. SIO1A7]
MGLQIFSQLALTCKDPIATEKWYSKHFGFKRARVAKLPDGNQIVFIKMEDSAFYLELFKASEDSPIEPAKNDGYNFPSVRQIGFKVDSVDEKLKEMGDDAKITLGPLDFDPWIPGWRTVWIADPDGLIVEISEGFKDEENPPPLEG